MKVLVTGATGLVGINTVKELQRQGHDVHVLVRSPDKLTRVAEPLDIDIGRLTLHRGDITRAEDIEVAMADCDAVVHAAGIFSANLEEEAWIRKVNVDGTRHVLAGAVAAGLDPIIHISSIVALFPPPGALQTVNDPVRTPDSMYARSKADAERIARDYQAQGSPVVILYPGMLQAPHDPTFNGGPAMVGRYLREGKIPVTEGGLAYTDARDFARAIAACLEAGKGPRRYMFGGHFLDHQAFYELLCRLTGRSLTAQRIPGWLLRAMGKMGDFWTRVSGKVPELTFEAASILTRSVPCDDRATLEEFQLKLTSAEDSFRDVLRWMHEAGHVPAEAVGEVKR